MYRRIFIRSLLLLIVTTIAATLPLSASDPVRLLSADWEGTTLVLEFDNPVAAEVDLAESDSNLTLRFASGIETDGVISIDDGAGAVGTFYDEGRAFRLAADDRLGYSILYRPHTHRLLLHTFDWDSLDYAAEQYHLGLLALERGIPESAIEFLTAARNSDTGGVARRASSVLGVLHQELGNDSLARMYLQNPSDADDWGARAAMLRASGDTAAAASAEEQMIASIGRNEGITSDVDPTRRAPTTPTIGDGTFLKKWQGIGLAIVAGLLILVIATMFARTTPEATKAIEESAEHHRQEALEAARGSSKTETSEAPPPVEVVEPIEVPETDLIPPVATADEKQRDFHPFGMDRNDPEPKTDAPVDQEIAPKPETPSPPAVPATGAPAAKAPTDRTLSRQAARLREQVEAVRRDESSTSTEVGSTDKDDDETDGAEAPDATILADARRRNHSRDFVELQRRIQSLRPDSDAG